MGLDIIFSDSQKKLITFAINFLRKKLGKVASREAIEEEMKNCSNDAIRLISSIITKNADYIEPERQKYIMKDYSNLFLWFLLHDTAYRNPGFATLDEILKHGPEIRKMIKPFVLPHEKWYCNVWWKRRDMTFKKRDKGEIPQSAYDVVDAQCVPNLHIADLKKQLKKIKEGK